MTETGLTIITIPATDGAVKVSFKTEEALARIMQTLDKADIKFNSDGTGMPKAVSNMEQIARALKPLENDHSVEAVIATALASQPAQQTGNQVPQNTKNSK